jgi:hypothetical protein
VKVGVIVNTWPGVLSMTEPPPFAANRCMLISGKVESTVTVVPDVSTYTTPLITGGESVQAALSHVVGTLKDASLIVTSQSPILQYSALGCLPGLYLLQSHDVDDEQAEQKL